VGPHGKSTWIDPGIPAARRAVLDAITRVVDRYDVDGVHLDDYFIRTSNKGPLPNDQAETSAANYKTHGAPKAR
jgi:uncharacterized lipoprotein YddW (UPF0748 family)